MIIENELHNNFPNNLGFKTFLKYYPIKFDVSQDYRDNRTAVYRFKDGYENINVDNLFITAINEFKRNKNYLNYWLCVIPASTIIKTQSRFEDFCERISDATDVNNGYDLIEPIEDRDEVHLGGHRNYSHILESLEFGEITGKHIILLDDVVTVGRSFRIISNHLITLGARSVNGIMLAKTHWLEEH